MSGPKIIDTAALRALERLRLRALCAQLECAIARCNAVVDGLPAAARFGLDGYGADAMGSLRGKLGADTLSDLRDGTRLAEALLGDVRDRRKAATSAAVDWRARDRANRLALREMATALALRAAAHPEALALVRQAAGARESADQARLLEQAARLCDPPEESTAISSLATPWLRELGTGGTSRIEAPVTREQREMSRLLAELETFGPEESEAFALRLEAAGALAGEGRALALDSLRVELAERARFLRKQEARRDTLEHWQARALDPAFEATPFLARLEAAIHEDSAAFEQTAEALGKAYEGFLDRQSADEARAAILDALGELGYEVREGMERAWSEQGKVYLSKPSSQGYALELATTPARASRLRTRLVRTGGRAAESSDERRRDREEEERWCADRWCADRDALAEILAHDDIEVTVKVARPAGEEPLAVIDSAATTRQADTRALRERENR